MGIKYLKGYDAATRSDFWNIYRKKHGSEKKHLHREGVPIKNLKKEALNEASNKHNKPSIVARLMGLDTLPNSRDCRTHKETKNIISRSNEPEKQEKSQNSFDHQNSFHSKPLKQEKNHPFLHDTKQDLDLNHQNHYWKTTRPKPREHPQEEQLQKLKEDFEAWQRARMWESSNKAEVHNSPEKRESCPSSIGTDEIKQRRKTKEIPSDFDMNGSPTTTNRSMGYDNKIFWNDQEEINTMRERKRIWHCEECDEKSLFSSKIVILKAFPEEHNLEIEYRSKELRVRNKRESVEDLLEEVKRRLRFEMQGITTKKERTVQKGCIENFVRNIYPDPKEIAQNIAKQARENETRDLRMNLPKCTRSIIDVDKEPRFSVLDIWSPKGPRQRQTFKCGCSVGHCGYHERPKLEPKELNMRFRSDASKTVNNLNCREEMRDETILKNGSLTPCKKNYEEFNCRPLVRSLSAPISGISYDSFLLDSQNYQGTPKNKRHGILCRDDVDKFFYKMINPMNEWGLHECNEVAIAYAPESIPDLGHAQDNFTEVPPTPASLCNTPPDELSEIGEYPSPVSPLDIASVEDNPITDVFSQISSDLKELRRKIRQLEADGYRQTVTDEEEHPESQSRLIKDEEESYIRNVLVASGLYGSFDVIFSLLNMELTQPIDKWVFKDIEKKYGDLEKSGETLMISSIKVSRHLLFDLLNECLLMVKQLISNTMSVEHIKKMNDLPLHQGEAWSSYLWKMIQTCTHSLTNANCDSVFDVVINDLMKGFEPVMIHEEVYVIGKTMEEMILDDMMHQILEDFCSNQIPSFTM